jgi:DNA-binding NarL/FixJ family response regulator
MRTPADTPADRRPPADGDAAAPPASLWRVLPSDETSPRRLAHHLTERIKELNCLYGIAQLAERHPSRMDAILAGTVRLLPPAWQFPDVASARIRFRGRIYDTPGFRESRWRQSAPLTVAGAAAGEVVVCYRTARPAFFEGPFLREERTLINAVAEHLGVLARRIEAERQLHETNRLLTVEREALREANAALRVVLTRIDEEKRELGRSIRANVERVLLPILHALALEVPAPKRAYVELLRASLDDITAPFIDRLAAACGTLTPAEVAVVHMIRSGLRTKEIARLRGTAPATVCRQREQIRRKLGLVRRGLNLAAHLQGAAFAGQASAGAGEGSFEMALDKAGAAPSFSSLSE